MHTSLKKEPIKAVTKSQSVHLSGEHLKRFTSGFMPTLRSNIIATITCQLTSEITSRLVQGEPEDEDGDAGVLDARLDGDGNDVFERPAADFGSDAAEAKPEPGQRHAGDENAP